MAGSPSSAVQRPDLGATLVQFPLSMERQGFIAPRIAPVVNVSEPAMNIGRIKIEALIKERDTARAMRGGYSRQNYEWDTFNFSCEEHGAEEPVDDREARIYERYIDAEMVARDRAYSAIQRNAEIRMAALIFNATTWTSYTSACTTPLDTSATSLPINYVKTARAAVRTQCGLEANAAIMSWTVFENLKETAQILDRIKYWGGDDPKNKNVTAPMLAAALGLEEIIVAGAIKDTAKEGQTRSLGDVWDDEYIMVCRVARTNDVREPCIARTFHYTGDGSVYDGRVESYRDETIRSDIVRVRHDVDELVMYTECGYLLSNATT